MTSFGAKGLEIFQSICVYWILEPPYWPLVVNLEFVWRKLLFAPLACEVISCQDYGSQICHTWPCFPSHPVRVCGEFLPYDLFLHEVWIWFQEAFPVERGGSIPVRFDELILWGSETGFPLVSFQDRRDAYLFFPS